MVSSAFKHIYFSMHLFRPFKDTNYRIQNTYYILFIYRDTQNNSIPWRSTEKNILLSIPFMFHSFEYIEIDVYFYCGPQSVYNGKGSALILIVHRTQNNSVTILCTNNNLSKYVFSCDRHFKIKKKKIMHSFVCINWIYRAVQKIWNVFLLISEYRWKRNFDCTMRFLSWESFLFWELYILF